MVVIAAEVCCAPTVRGLGLREGLALPHGRVVAVQQTLDRLARVVVPAVDALAAVRRFPNDAYQIPVQFVAGGRRVSWSSFLNPITVKVRRERRGTNVAEVGPPPCQFARSPLQ